MILTRLPAAATILLASCASPVIEDQGVCLGSIPKPDGLVVAGSGVNLAPVSLVARRYQERFPERRVRLEPSIGTSGAVRALADNMIDIGLASRPLAKKEVRLGVTEYPFATVPLTVVVHTSHVLTGIDVPRLSQIYDGRITRWSTGQPIVLLVRQAGDSVTTVIDRNLPTLGAALHRARLSGRALTQYTDQQMRDALLTIDGAIGFLDTGTINLAQLPLRPIPIEGIEPTAAAVLNGSHPLSLTLSFLTRENPTEAELDFVRFGRSHVVCSDLETAGYMVAPHDTEKGR